MGTLKTSAFPHYFSKLQPFEVPWNLAPYERSGMGGWADTRQKSTDRIIFANLHRQEWCLDNRNLTRDGRWASGRLSSGFFVLSSFFDLWRAFVWVPPTLSAITLTRLLFPARFHSMRRGNYKICAFCAKKQILWVENALGLFGFSSAVESVAFSPNLLYSKYFTDFV